MIFEIKANIFWLNIVQFMKPEKIIFFFILSCMFRIVVTFFQAFFHFWLFSLFLWKLNQFEMLVFFNHAKSFFFFFEKEKVFKQNFCIPRNLKGYKNDFHIKISDNHSKGHRPLWTLLQNLNTERWRSKFQMIQNFHWQIIPHKH